jgi:hypothetical protein
MKSVRQQFVDALGYKGKNSAHYLNFTLAVVGGVAVLSGEIYGMEAYSGKNPFDLKVAIGCFVLLGICVLLSKNRTFVLCVSLMVPAVLIWPHALMAKDRGVLVFYFVSQAIGLLIVVVGELAKHYWRGRSSLRSK